MILLWQFHQVVSFEWLFDGKKYPKKNNININQNNFLKNELINLQKFM